MNLRPVVLLLMAAMGVGACGTASVASEVGGLSPTARAALLARAERVAASNGDQRPYDIEAVRTTVRQAERLEGGEASSPAPGSSAYVVAMRGRFVCGGCSHPSQAKTPSGTVITLGLLARTLHEFEFGLGVRYPHLKKLGTPVRLK